MMNELRNKKDKNAEAKQKNAEQNKAREAAKKVEKAAEVEKLAAEGKKPRRAWDKDLVSPAAKKLRKKERSTSPKAHLYPDDDDE
jgi:hypothetical protein